MSDDFLDGCDMREDPEFEAVHDHDVVWLVLFARILDRHAIRRIRELREAISGP